MNSAVQLILHQRLCVFVLNILVRVAVAVGVCITSYFVVINMSFFPHHWMRVA